MIRPDPMISPLASDFKPEKFNIISPEEVIKACFDCKDPIGKKSAQAISDLVEELVERKFGRGFQTLYCYKTKKGSVYWSEELQKKPLAKGKVVLMTIFEQNHPASKEDVLRILKDPKIGQQDRVDFARRVEENGLTL